MVFEGLLTLLYYLLDLVFADVEMPEWAAAAEYITEFISYLMQGAAILVTYCPWQYMIGLLSVVLIIDGIVLTYKTVLWVLRKIPFIHIS